MYLRLFAVPVNELLCVTRVKDFLYFFYLFWHTKILTEKMPSQWIKEKNFGFNHELHLINLNYLILYPF